MNTELLKSKLLEAAFNGSLTHADISTWENVQLGEIGTIVTGSTPSKANSEFYGNDYPFYKPGDLDQGINTDKSVDGLSKIGYEHARHLPANSILVTCIGSIGKTGLIRREGACNQQINAIIPNDKCNCFYIYYLMISSAMQEKMNFLSRSMTMAILNKSKFSCMEIPLPPLTEQQRIVAALEEGFAYIDAVASAKQNLSNTAEMLRSKILQAAFDGSLTSADASTWDWTPMKHVTKIMCDGDWIEKKDQSENGIRLVQTGNVGNGCFIDKPNSYKYISEDTFKRLNCTEIFPGDILFSRLPSPVGRACELPQVNYRMITAVDCTIVRLKEIIDKKFFLYYVQSPTYHYKMAENNFITGTTRARISRSNLEKMPVPLPPLAEQQRIVAKIEELFEQIDKITK